MIPIDTLLCILAAPNVPAALAATLANTCSRSVLTFTLAVIPVIAALLMILAKSLTTFTVLEIVSALPLIEIALPAGTLIVAVSEVATGRFKFVGSAVEKNTESYIGSGALFGFSSTTEAVGSNPPESTALFRFTGSATESIAPAPHIGSGSIFTFISFTETIAISPDDTKVLFTFVGEATNKKTDSYRGTGSLFAITGSYESTRVIAQLTGVLFGIFGRALESYGYSNYDGIGFSQMEGLATTSTVEFEPAKPIRIMMI